MYLTEMKDWTMHEFSTGTVAGNDYRMFEEDAKEDLERMLEPKGIKIHSFNSNHYCFTVVVTRNGRYAYISIQDVRYFRNEWYCRVLYRDMKHETDWSGGFNRRCAWYELPKCLDGLFLRRERTTV